MSEHSDQTDRDDAVAVAIVAGIVAVQDPARSMTLMQSMAAARSIIETFRERGLRVFSEEELIHTVPDGEKLTTSIAALVGEVAAVAVADTRLAAFRKKLTTLVEDEMQASLDSFRDGVPPIVEEYITAEAQRLLDQLLLGGEAEMRRLMRARTFYTGREHPVAYNVALGWGDGTVSEFMSDPMKFRMAVLRKNADVLRNEVMLDLEAQLSALKAALVEKEQRILRLEQLRHSQ